MSGNLDAELAELKKHADSLTPKLEELTLKEFLEKTPPDTFVRVTDVEQGSQPNTLHLPTLQFFCEHDNCGGFRWFDPTNGIYLASEWRYQFLQYRCRNCGLTTIQIAIAIKLEKLPSNTGGKGKAICLKVGQVPAFGPYTPSRLINFIGPDRDLFLQGRRAENRGLGIGAFGYYRRVVENQKNRIISEIAKVAKRLGSAPETDRRFSAAIAEIRFTQSIEMVKDVIPQTLMISGRNPLVLLHSALSKGLHDPDMTDARCLQLAQSIRIVLAELADRVSQALKDDKEIQSALSVLMAFPSEPKIASGSTMPTTKDSESQPE